MPANGDIDVSTGALVVDAEAVTELLGAWVSGDSGEGVSGMREAGEQAAGLRGKGRGGGGGEFTLSKEKHN